MSFKLATRRDAAGVPRVAADFVAEQGQLVRILDVRDEADLCGPLGHIPAVTHLPLDKITEVCRVLDRETCVVIVSKRGARAGIAARLLEELGMQYVAAMDGGMMAWKQLGFTTLRDHESYRKTLVALAPGVGRSGKPLVKLAPGAKLTAELIAEHVLDPLAVRWVKLGAFLLHGKRSCVDGRDEQGVIGTPGGDAGELLLALAVTERITRKSFSDEDVERILVRHIDTFGRFYMHTDVIATTQLIVEGYHKDPRIAPHVANLASAEDWRHFHKRPPPEIREAVLEHLVKPELMGCGHLRLAMMLDEYGVRPALARAFLRAFHRLRWTGSPELEWVVLGGAHEEGAVANVVVDGNLHTYTRIPLVSPSVSGVQMFVNHPQVTAFLRRELAAFLCEIGAAPPPEADVVDAIEQLGAVQARVTLGRLAGELPVFEIRFDHDGKAAVEPRGVIPTA
ncbi:MAG TPA: rhodanese-like domain-containing protein [Kofleriaceae bacterium]|nr:rhodanese-like domain-containing protein [Kofleriaceae bacterium]